MATKALIPSELQKTGHFRQHWEIVVRAETTQDDLLRPDFWVHVAQRLTPMSLISVMCEDESWYAELIVLRSGVGYAKVKALQVWRFDEGEEIAAQDSTVTEVKWAGPKAKYRVVRKSDKQVLKDGFGTSLEAENWQRQLEAMLAKAA